MARQDGGQALTPKQRRFIQEYLVDLNAAQAAIRAGYSGRTAKEQASRLLTKVNVQAAITAAMTARAQRVELTQDAVVRELALLATSTIEHYAITDQGEVSVRAGSPAGALRAIASLKKKITHTEAGVSYETTITLWNKPASVRMAGEHLGLFSGRGTPLPDIHVHMDTARDRLSDRLAQLATRHAEEATSKPLPPKGGSLRQQVLLPH